MIGNGMSRTLLLLGMLLGCGAAGAGGPTVSIAPPDAPKPAEALKKGQAEAIFASGCFWCAEKDFEKLDGVLEVYSGYAGSPEANPTYKQVGSGSTGHTEAIRVVFDPKKITYEQLLAWYWRHVDPFDAGGQFCDRGSQYRPAILPVDQRQRKLAEVSKGDIEAIFNRKVAVNLEAPHVFWVAEEYHQDFYKKNPAHYQRYRTGCGRDARVAAVWAGVEQPKSP